MAPKLTTPERQAVYSELYDKANNLFKMHNPCQISSDGKSCAGSDSNLDGLCCVRCSYLGPNGCTVESLTCKLWTCRKLQNDPKLHDFHYELQLIRDKRREASIPSVIRGSKEDHFGSPAQQQERIRNSYQLNLKPVR